MRWFRRGSTGSSQDDFWHWWASSRDRTADAIAQGLAPSLATEFSRQVRGVDPRLAWELAPGTRARHALIVSPEGNPALRPVALRWLADAPEPDETWEYHAARQPGPLRILEIGGQRFDLSAVRASADWDDTRELLDVRIWHPGFSMTAPALQNQVAMLFLDNLLGDDVERWIGAMTVAEPDSESVDRPASAPMSRRGPCPRRPTCGCSPRSPKERTPARSS